jgi:hypothetical protein
MPLGDYFNLFTDSAISNPSEMEKYSRYLDAAIAQDSIKLDDIVGLGEATTSLYVITRHAVMTVGEFGLFKKRVEARQVTPVAAIARFATSDTYPTPASIKFEGRTQAIFNLTGWDSKGQVTLDIKWQDDSLTRVISRQREHLFKLLGEATGQSPRAKVGLKPLSSRGESMVKLLADGNSYQFLGVNADGVWMFRGEFDDALNVYAGRLAVLEQQWTSHVAANLYK